MFFTLDDVEFRVACFILLLRRRAVPVKNLLAGGVAPLLCWPRRPRSSCCLPDCFSGLQIRGGREKRLKKISNSLLVLQYPIFFFRPKSLRCYNGKTAENSKWFGAQRRNLSLVDINKPLYSSDVLDEHISEYITHAHKIVSPVWGDYVLLQFLSRWFFRPHSGFLLEPD